MSKLSEKYSDINITGPLNDFIYFSPMRSGHGPRIKFYGGTKSTKSTQNCPAFGFSKSGATVIYLENWMNKDNCPNAFDNDYLKTVKAFINKHLSTLLLVWYMQLDESDLLHYFEGSLSWEQLIQSLEFYQDHKELDSIKDEDALHAFCLENNLYTF